MPKPRHARPLAPPPEWAFRLAVILDGLLAGMLAAEWWS